jgi:hypothetical protein
VVHEAGKFENQHPLLADEAISALKSYEISYYTDYLPRSNGSFATEVSVI